MFRIHAILKSGLTFENTYTLWSEVEKEIEGIDKAFNSIYKSYIVSAIDAVSINVVYTDGSDKTFTCTDLVEANELVKKIKQNPENLQSCQTNYGEVVLISRDCRNGSPHRRKLAPA